MDCVFCWSWRTRQKDIGCFFSPEQVAERLVRIAKENRFSSVRISGNEPTLCKDHLLSVIENVEKLDPRLLFILETNGIEIGKDKDFSKELSGFRNLHVRVSFKTGNPENFELITGRPKEWFEIQIMAIKNLYENKISFHPAIVKEFFDEYLIRRLEKISPHLPSLLEYESLILYPHVEERMRKRGLQLEFWRRI